MIHGKTLEAWYASHPLLSELLALRETAWFNPAIAPTATALADVGLTAEDVAAASARLQRFAPYLAKVFPETAAAGGIIESPLVPLPDAGAPAAGRARRGRGRRAVAESGQPAAHLRLDQGARRYP